MMQLQKGQKIQLAQLGLNTNELMIEVVMNASFTLDSCCFCLNKQHKLSQDEDMIFYNQRKHPNQSVELDLQPEKSIFNINLNFLHHDQRLMLCVTVDHANQNMSNIQNSQIFVKNKNNEVVARFELTPEQFEQEKAVMLVELYYNNAWRLGTVAQGFNGGLPALVEYFGKEVAYNKPEPSLNNKIDLKKKLILDKIEKTQPSLIDLTKKSFVILEKNNLLDIQANVALVLDVTGSMNQQYKNGDVQKVLDRLLPLALNFDDNGAFECWAFAEHATRLSDVSLQNLNGFVQKDSGVWKKWNCGARWNNDPSAIRTVLDYYQSAHNNLPTYVLFISDGGISKDREITKLMREAAYAPIFWQFVGVGGSNYGILEKLDNLDKRIVDNCDFFALDHIHQLSDEDLYIKLLQEFPLWLKEIKQKHIQW